MIMQTISFEPYDKKPGLATEKEIEDCVIAERGETEAASTPGEQNC